MKIFDYERIQEKIIMHEHKSGQGIVIPKRI